MPCGPKKRRALKKKQQAETSSSLPTAKLQGSETQALGDVNIAVEIDDRLNQCEEKTGELQDEISNQGTFSVSHAEDLEQTIHNPVIRDRNVVINEVVGTEVAEKFGSEVLSSVTSIESVQITGDNSVFDESNRAVGLDGVAASGLSLSKEVGENTADEPVKETIKVVKTIRDANDDESYQSGHKTELLVSEKSVPTASVELQDDITSVNAASKGLQITEDKSVHDESNRDVGSESVALDHLSSSDPLKNVFDEKDYETLYSLPFLLSESQKAEISAFIDMIKALDQGLESNEDESVHETNQASETITSELVKSDVHNKSVHETNQAVEVMNITDEVAVSIEGTKNDKDVSEMLKHNTDDVVEELNPSVPKSGTEDVIGKKVSENAGSKGLQVTEDKHVHDEANRDVASESMAEDILDENDNGSNQSVDKALSKIVQAVDLLLISNEPVESTEDKSVHKTYQASGIIATDPVKSDVDKSVNETNQAVEKAESEILKNNTDDVVQVLNPTVAKAGSEVFTAVMNPTDEVTESIQGVNIDKDGSGMVAPVTESIHEAIAENMMVDGQGIIMPNEEAIVTEDVQDSCDPNDSNTEYGALLNKLIADSRSSNRMKHVKEVLEKELMETDKLRLVLKNALDQLTLAIDPDVASA